MEISAMSPDFDVATPYMVLLQVRGVRCAFTVARFLVLGARIGHTKNREIHQSLALGDCRLGVQNNNQPKIGIIVRYDVVEDRGGQGAACGRTLSHHLGRRMEQHKNNKNKIHCDIYRPPIGGPTHNNRPK